MKLCFYFEKVCLRSYKCSKSTRNTTECQIECQTVYFKPVEMAIVSCRTFERAKMQFLETFTLFFLLLSLHFFH